MISVLLWWIGILFAFFIGGVTGHTASTKVTARGLREEYLRGHNDALQKLEYLAKIGKPGIPEPTRFLGEPEGPPGFRED